jgi:hypothetical protein
LKAGSVSSTRFIGTRRVGGYRRRPKKSGGDVEIALNQKDGRCITQSHSILKDLSVFGEGGDRTAVSDGYEKSDADFPRFFSVSFEQQERKLI